MDGSASVRANRGVRDLFVSALDLPAGADRLAWVARTCGDNEPLHREVLDLLAAHFRADASPLDALVDQLDSECLLHGAVDAEPPIDISTHPMVGPYELIEQIGEGGMGAVYLARQLTPIRREVALKVIKPGMDSREVIARFEAERQSLAMMEHPHIARVLDAGATGGGRPYFVMELVRGTPITEYCRRAGTSLCDRLQLFVDVCQAVQHAHLKGIIHRDLKPSNVLVTQGEGRPTVKVIDFGVAKALHDELTERTRFTQLACIVGTPMYMSPEQAELGGLDIDTRSDVYSLGVLLYELVTGTKPFDRETLTKASFDEMRRIIREESPPRPSSRLSTLHAAADPTLHRSVEERRRLARQLSTELDWVVMKALEKDRERRYQSASDLAADVGNFLNDEPVIACPPSTAYRLKKLVRRHGSALAAAGAITALLIVGLFVTSRLAIRARQAEQQAIEASRLTRAAAERQRRLLYDSDMLLASQAWRHDDARQLAERLSRHVPPQGVRDLRGFEWFFLARQQNVQGTELARCDGAIYDLAISPDKRRIAVVGQDAVLKICDAATGRLLVETPTGQGETNGVAFSPDGTTVAAVGDDGTLRLFDPDTLREVLCIEAHTDLAFRVCFSPDGRRIATCGRDQKLKLWDAATGELQGAFNDHTGRFEYMVISPDGLLAVGDRDARVTVWDARTQALVSEFVDETAESLSSLAFSQNGYLACGTVDGRLYIIDPKSGALVARRTMADGVQSLAFAPDGLWLAIGDRNGGLRIVPFEQGLWDIDAARTWPAHQGRVYSVAVEAGGKRILSAGEDGRLIAWNPLETAASHVTTLENESFSLAAVDARTIAVGVQNGVSLYSETGEFLRQTASAPGSWDVWACRETGCLFAANPASLLGWRIGPGEEIFRLSASPEAAFLAVAASPDGRTLCGFTESLAGDYELQLIDAELLQTKGRFPLRSAKCRDVSHDGRWLAFDADNGIQVLDLQERRIVGEWPAHQGAVRGLRIAADSQRLVSVSADRMLKVWSLPGGELRGSVVAHRIDILSVAVTSDGRRIATGGADQLLRLWDGDSLQLLFEYPSPHGPIHDLRFLDGNHRLACLCGDRTLLILDGSPLAPPGDDASRNTGEQPPTQPGSDTTDAARSSRLEHPPA